MVLALRVLAGQRFYQITAVWCLVPFIWGVWMVLAPQRWIEKRLPAWGAILGAIASMTGLYVLNVPQRVGVFIPPALKPAGVLLMAAMYAIFWIVVGKVYRALRPTSAPISRSAAA